MASSLRTITASIMILMLAVSIFGGSTAWANELDETVESTETVETVEIQDLESEPESDSEDQTGNTTETEEEIQILNNEENTSEAEESLVLMNGQYFAGIAEAVAAAEDTATITLVGDVVIDSTITIPSGKDITITDDGSKRTISRGDGSSTISLFKVSKGSTLTFDGSSDDTFVINGGTFTSSSSASVAMVNGTLNIKNVTIDGGTIRGTTFTGVITAASGATVNMTGGVVENTNFPTNGWYSSPLLIKDGSTFNMSGGTIRNNYNGYRDGLSGGGGVLLLKWNSGGDNTTMNMTGGTIQGNTAIHGGGVYMTGFTSMSMTGGKIIDNKAFSMGGGVCVSGISATKDYTSKFVLDGGTISNNSARTGGGIYVNTDEVYLESGLIEGNSANPSYWGNGHGGGVYVSEVPRVLHVEEAVITENTAKASNGADGMGGGLWACPTGTIELKVSDGVAVFDNEAVGDDSAGDDVAKVDNYNGNGTLTLPDRTLGGGAVKWYQDGAVTNGVVGGINTSVARYSKTDPGERYHIDNYTSSIALKAEMSDAAKDRAYAEAKMIIRNNTAAHGGGIGTNGDLAVVDKDYSEWSLKATKEWECIPEENWEEVEVFLKIGDEILDSVKLNAENDWTATFENLPDPDSLDDATITVVEGSMVTDADGNKTFKETDKYIATYAQLLDTENKTIYVNITNQLKPSDDEPEEPTEPDTPDEPDEPDTPDEPEDNTPDTMKSSTETGDSMNIMFFFIIAGLAAAVGVGITVRGRRQI